jgi:hypothetical protein
MPHAPAKASVWLAEDGLRTGRTFGKIQAIGIRGIAEPELFIGV